MAGFAYSGVLEERTASVTLAPHPIAANQGTEIPKVVAKFSDGSAGHAAAASPEHHVKHGDGHLHINHLQVAAAAKENLQHDSLAGRGEILKTAAAAPEPAAKAKPEASVKPESAAKSDVHPLRVTAAPLPEGALTPKKSLEELTKAGLIGDNRRPANVSDAAAPEGRPITSFEKPKIEVNFADTLEQQGKKPDIVIGAKGEVIMNNNPEKTSNGSITVGLEREGGSVTPTAEQQKAVSQLYQYLDARLKEQNPALAQDGIALDNNQGLVPDAVAKAAKAKRGSEAPVPDGASEQGVHNFNRFNGSHGGKLSRGDVGEMFPGRDFDSRHGKTDGVTMMKDVVSSLNGSKGDHNNIGFRRGRGAAVGPYGITGDQFASWIGGLSDAELAELEKKDPAAAAKLRAMRDQIKAGKTPDLIKKMQQADAGNFTDQDKKDILGTFGKDVQEMAATSLINKYSTEINNQNGGKDLDPGKIALAMQLGHVPTGDELNSPDNQDYMKAANKAWQIAGAASRFGADGVAYGNNGDIVQASMAADGHAKWGRFAASVNGGRLGCAASVSQVLNEAGVNVSPNAGAYALQAQLQQRGWQAVAINQARPGDVIYGGGPGAANGGGNAHIGIYEGNGLVGANSSSRGVWRSHQPLMSAFGRFVRNGGSQLYALRPPEKSTEQA